MGSSIPGFSPRLSCNVEIASFSCIGTKSEESEGSHADEEVTQDLVLSQGGEKGYENILQMARKGASRGPLLGLKRVGSLGTTEPAA